MVQLAIYAPLEAEDDTPVILPFRREAAANPSKSCFTPAARARLERANHQCPCCRRVTVQPIELHDAVTNWNGASVPGTATIVGFHCNACRYEWPARDRSGSEVGG